MVAADIRISKRRRARCLARTPKIQGKFKSNIQKNVQPVISDSTRSRSQSPEVGVGIPTTSTNVKQQSPNMDFHLYKAAIEGNVDNFINDLAQYSEEKKIPLLHTFEQITPQGNNFLHVAASFGHRELVRHVAHQFRDLLIRTNHDGDTSLHLAARSGHLAVVEILVRLGYGESAFSERSEDDKGLIKILNKEGNTPLHEAMINCCDGVVNFLLSFKPDAVCYMDKDGKSVLFLALESGKDDTTAKDMIRGLKEYRHNLVSHGRSKSLDELIITHGNSLVQAAIFWRSRELIEEILSIEHTLINSKNKNGQNLLHFASSIGFVDGVELLLNKFSMNAFETDDDGLCAIHIACKNAHVDVIEELLRHCPDAKEFHISSSRQNILHIAAKNGKDKMVKYILNSPKLETLINDKDEDGNTPLHLAALNWHPKVVSSLAWDKRVKVKLLNNEGLTALEVAEEDMESMPSYRKRLTWMALMSAGVPRGKHWKTANLNRLKSTACEPYNMDYYKDRVNTLLLVSILIATVTFAAGFTAPGGNNNSEPDQGMASMVSKKMFQTFVVCDTIAMYSSVLVSVTLIWAQLGDLNMVYNALRLSLPMLGVSLSMMSLAFFVSLHLVVSKVAWLATFVLIMGVIYVSSLMALFVPLCLPYTSNYRIVRRICYYPFCLLMLASGSYDNDTDY